VVFALLITGTNFNVASFMGLIMVIGIVAKNGILLLDADEQLRAGGLGAREAMLHAVQRRRRPILMTAIATVCGMFPLALALGAGSQMLQPLAIAVIGGLSISIVLSLVVTGRWCTTTSESTRTAGWDFENGRPPTQDFVLGYFQTSLRD
jgi:multidrug efflux pump subunit AcrB